MVLPKKGNLLIAKPKIIGDVAFNRAVILLADQNKAGAVGFILNKPLKYNLNDLIKNTTSSFKVYNGGPVDQDNLYYVHNVPHLIPDSVEISGGIYWGGNFEIAITLINTNTISENNIRFFLGYSGWKNEQLVEELDSKAWLVSKNDINAVFFNNSTFWKDKMLELGGEFSIWSNAPENPSHN